MWVSFFLMGGVYHLSYILFLPCYQVIDYYFLLGFMPLFGFLGGIRCSRLQLLVLKRMHQYGPGTNVG